MSHIFGNRVIWEWSLFSMILYIAEVGNLTIGIASAVLGTAAAWIALWERQTRETPMMKATDLIMSIYAIGCCNRSEVIWGEASHIIIIGNGITSWMQMSKTERGDRWLRKKWICNSRRDVLGKLLQPTGKYLIPIHFSSIMRSWQ